MKSIIWFVRCLLLILAVNISAIPLCAADPASANATAVITLNNRTPEDVINAIQPFLAKGAVVKPFENQVIIQSTADNIATLKTLIAQIDVPIKKLMISVSNGHDRPSEAMSIMPNGEVKFDQANGARSMNFSTRRDQDTQMNYIRVDNGQVAFINTGVTIPMISQQFAADDNYQRNSQFNSKSEGQLQGAIVNGNFNRQASGTSSATDIARAAGQSFDYQTLNNGILVRPELVGKQVKLTLLTQNDQPTANFSDTTQATYTSFKANTTLMVPLSQWVYFGGNQDRTDIDNRNSFSTRSRDTGKKDLWLRVDLIPDQ